jgi:hypothetical protein
MRFFRKSKIKDRSLIQMSSIIVQQR